MRHTCASLALALASACAPQAASAPATTPTAPAAASELAPLRTTDHCATGAFRGLDFWLGRWRVTGADGSFQGINEIVADLSGCRLIETWRGAQGGIGGSVNYYDAHTQTWRQIWTDDEGGGIDYQGTADGTTYEVAGTMRDRSGASSLTRMTIRVVGPTTVRQTIVESKDGGTTWLPWFDGLYTRLP